MKHDLRHKARLVILGNRVDLLNLPTRATVVKGFSVRLLDIIAHRDNLKILCGDIGNAFVMAHTKEKVFTVCGKEFGPDRVNAKAVIDKALYGLCTSAERFHTLLADFLCTLEFNPSVYDRDVWLRDRGDGTGYDYICTHVDDFKIVAKDPDIWMEKL